MADPYGTLVLSWMPCHCFTRSPSVALTRRCCLSMFKPRNFSEVTSMPYMDPQPPEISCTTSCVGASSLISMSQTCDSPSERYFGFSGVPEAENVSCGAAEEAVEVEVEKSRRRASVCGSCVRESKEDDRAEAADSDCLCVV